MICKKISIMTLVTLLIFGALSSIFVTTAVAEPDLILNCSASVWEEDKVYCTTNLWAKFTYSQTGRTKFGTSVSFSTNDVGNVDKTYTVTAQSLSDPENTDEANVLVRHRFLSVDVEEITVNEGDTIPVWVMDHLQTGATASLELGENTGYTVMGTGSIIAPDVEATEIGGIVTLPLIASKNKYAPDSIDINIIDTDTEPITLNVLVSVDGIPVEGAAVIVFGGHPDPSSGLTQSNGVFTCTVYADEGGVLVTANATYNDLSREESSIIYSDDPVTQIIIELTEDDEVSYPSQAPSQFPSQAPDQDPAQGQQSQQS